MQYFRLLFVVLVIGLVGAGCATHQLPSEKNILRVLTYNIHHGEGTDGKIDIERIATLIKDSRADIVALQEVDRWTKRTGRIDIMSELVDRTDMAYAFGKTIEIDSGDYGNGILTRYPIYEESNFLYTFPTDVEQRGLLQLVLNVRGQEIVFMSTHLDYWESDADRIASVEHIREAAKRYAPRP
ncbi:MAG: endonuclease/exonuclease/phosphatase family protein, partial [Ignavibacteriae bacterium]|nr:endonuclease/exonuclease/phosphatase family protein [Ignavibacteriota bacterium]